VASVVYNGTMEIERRYLPSTRFIAWTIVGVGIIIAFALTRYIPSRGTVSPEATIVAREITPTRSESDSDSDGLRDWEEVLWGTDPNNADSDGDGATDGEEVNANRHPGIAGPNDILSVEPEKTAESGFAEPSNYTDAFSRELLAQYLQKKQNNTLYLEGPDVFFNSVFSSVNQGQNTYVITDLSFSATTNNARYTFANTFADTIANINVAAVNTSGGPAELAVLAPRFTQAAADAVEIPVPYDIGETYLDAVNAIAAIGLHMRAISTIVDDPVGGLAAMGGYESSVNALADAMRSIGLYLQEKQVLFGDSDAGRVLIDGL